MIKTLSQALRMDKERFKVPKSIQQAIPIQRIWPDGIFQQGTKFSKTYRFTDINYYIASKDNKTEMFLDYSELLNSLDSGISAKITINNRRINKEEFEKSILLPMKEDGLDHYREEYNEMLLSKITGTNNSIYQERYLTVSVHKRSIDDARNGLKLAVSVQPVKVHRRSLACSRQKWATIIRCLKILFLSLGRRWFR